MINTGLRNWRCSITLILSCCARLIIVSGCYGLMTYELSKYDENVEVCYEHTAVIDAGNKKGSEAPFCDLEGMAEA